MSGIEHVLFCIADQWRGDALGFLGAPGVRTPNLDALATEGVAFTNHWCQASPCGPSRRSLLTGTQVATHGQWTNDGLADQGLPTLASVVRAGGTDPLLIGYTDTPQVPVPGAPPGAEFFEPAWEVVRPFCWQLGFPAFRAHLESLGYGPFDHPMGVFAAEGEPSSNGLAPARLAADHTDVAYLTDAAIEVIHQRSAPWLLHVNWLRPHPPMTPPAPYHRLVDPDEVALPTRTRSLEDQLDQHPLFDLAGRDRSMTEYTQQRTRIEFLTERDERHIRAAYYGLAAEVDHHVGRLIDALRASGRYDSTLIIFGSDHGDALGDHWLYGRRGPFDGHFRVPCIIRDPRPSADATRGERVDHFTANLDLLPTMLESLDLAIPESVEGASLLGHLDGSGASSSRDHVRFDMDWTDSVRSARRPDSPLRFSAIRTERYRYVRFNSSEPMLFDLVEDPHEHRNRSTDPALAGVEADLADLLR